VIGLDTNILVRYIVQDDPKQSPVATRLVENECTAERPGFVTLIVLVELVWVLETCYESAKTDILAVLRTLLRAKQLVVEEAETAWKGVRLFEGCSADFADCLIERAGDRNECEFTVTFDLAAAKAGMRLMK